MSNHGQSYIQSFGHFCASESDLRTTTKATSTQCSLEDVPLHDQLLHLQISIWSPIDYALEPHIILSFIISQISKETKGMGLIITIQSCFECQEPQLFHIRWWQVEVSRNLMELFRKWCYLDQHLPRLPKLDALSAWHDQPNIQGSVPGLVIHNESL